MKRELKRGQKNDITNSEYKGHKTISLLETGAEISDKYPPFSFGIKKAKLIIEHIEDIKKFVEEDEGK